MVELRWLPRVGPPIVALGAVVLLASASFGAIEPAWEPPQCSAGAGGRTAAARIPGPAGPEGLAGETTFRLDPRLDSAGTLVGQRLTIGGSWRPARLDLPPESFASGPFGRLVLVGSDDGRRSTLRAVDPGAGCAWPIATEGDVIRAATLDPAATSVYEFRVGRASRADLGVWRRPIGGGPPTRVMAAPAIDPRFGITFATRLTWSDDGATLAVQSCGAFRCRTRLLDPPAGTVRLVEEPEHGELVGIAAGRIVAHGACSGLPCPILSIDAETGRSIELVAQAGLARIVSVEQGPRVVAEVAEGGRLALDLFDPRGGATGQAALPDGTRLVPDAARSGTGLRVPVGWALVAADGRGLATASALVRLDDGAAVDLEVTR